MGKNGRGGGDVEREKAVRETNFKKRSGMGKDRDHERKKERQTR